LIKLLNGCSVSAHRLDDERSQDSALRPQCHRRAEVDRLQRDFGHFCSFGQESGRSGPELVAQLAVSVRRPQEWRLRPEYLPHRL